MLLLSTELRYQRWLSDPVAVVANSLLRSTTTWAGGARVVLKLSDTVTVRPGLSYTRGLDAPMTRHGYQVVQLDLPFSF
jgi:hypothetical protein